MTKQDFTIFEGDPDAIVLQTIEQYACGLATRDDVDAAIMLALEQADERKWRPEIRHRYQALVIWATIPAELDRMLDRALSYGVTVKTPRGVQ
jgi:hypothetical protein